MPPTRSAAQLSATRRRHLRAAGEGALIALLTFVAMGVWTSAHSLSRPDNVGVILGILAYAFGAAAVVRLICAAAAWPRGKSL